MKIALIGRYGEGEILSGPERVAKELYSALKNKNVDVVFIEYFFSGYSDYSFPKKISGSKLIGEGVYRLGIIPLIVKLLKENYDVIHFVNSQRFILIVFFLKIFFKSKFISTLHGLNKTEAKEIKLKRTFLDLWVEKKIILKSDVLIFPSNYLLKLFKKNYDLSQKKCIIIHNGISRIFHENKMTLFESLNKEGSVYNFIYFNSFNKGMEELLNENLKTINLPLRIFVIGKVGAIKVSNNNIEVIHVPQMNTDSLIQFLSDKHFIIKTSVYGFDAFSTIALECMAMGIIPVVQEGTGIKEIINRNVNGFIFDNSNEKLIPLLDKIYNGNYNLTQVSLNAARIYDELNWERVSGKYKLIYGTDD